MNKIKKALDVLSKTENPIIKADMIKVLREHFTGLENSFDASCNHNAELVEKKGELESLVAKTMVNNNGLKLLLEQALNALDWYREAHPEDDSQVDDEFRNDCNVFLNT